MDNDFDRYCISSDALYSGGYRRDLQQPLLMADDYASLSDPDVQYTLMCNARRCIVDIENLLRLFPKKCSDCGAQLDYLVDTKVTSYAILKSW